ncbi:MAG: MFS transporter [Halobacteriaceae archaeon]
MPDVSRLSRQQLLVAVAAAARFGSGILMGTGLAVFVERAGGSPFAVSMLFSAYFLGLTVFAPVWGAIADVTGRRRAVLVATGALATVSVLPLVAVEGVWPLVGARGLYAVFASGFPPVMLAVVSDRGGSEGRGRALGFFNSARAAGFMGGQLTVGAMLGLFAPDVVYLVIAGVSLVSTVALVFVDDRSEPSGGGGEASASGPTAADVLEEVRGRLLPATGEREHFRRNGLGWLYVALALRNMTVMGVMSLMPVFLTSGLGLTSFAMGVLLAINPATQTVTMYLFGRVADTEGRKPLITLGMVGSGAFAVAAALASVPATPLGRALVAAAGFVVIAAAFSAMTTGALAFIGDTAPAGRESELMGLRSTAKGVGGVVGPPAVGALATLTSYRSAFLAGSALAFAAAVLAHARLTETAPTEAAAVAADD